MDGERWARLEQLFADALALPVAARSDFLQAHCADDKALRDEITALLQAHEETGRLDRAAAAHALPSATSTASLEPGTQIGAWRLQQLLGRGGMGEVYAAIRADAGFEQRAALKLLRFDARAQLDRFHGERRILAKLEHPGIARLLDGGVTADGRHYTVMEYVEGVSLTEHCRAHALPLPRRLALFDQVCEAVAFAHRNLVIHRDLKPDNILVDAEGTVKLLDFGIAKLVDLAAQPDDDAQTLAPFTPDYAAPEQLTGAAVTTGTDIYGLGALLFELLTGERPLRSLGLPPTQIIKSLLDVDPPAPSRIAAGRADPPVPARLLQGDLDAIVAKCLRTRAGDRYETVNLLQRDIQRHLAHQPVLARSGARAYIARRFLRRHWLPMVVLGAFVTAMAAAALYANAARIETVRALARADAVRGFLIDLFRQNDPEAGNGRGMSARDLVDVGVRRIELDFANDRDTHIELLGVSGNLYRALGEYPGSETLLARRLELASQTYTEDDPRLIEAQLDMAHVEISAQKFDAAQKLLDGALAATTNKRPGLLGLRIRLLRAYGSLEGERDNDVAAIAWVDQAIALLRLSSAAPTEIAEALSERGSYAFRAGRIAESEQPLRDALAMLDPAAAENTAALLSVRETLGTVLTSLGRFDEVVPLLQTNANAVRRLYGDKHPRLANALHQLASALRQSGDSAAAAPLFQESLTLYEHNYGAEHSYAAVALTGLGQSLITTGQHAEATAALLRAQAIYAGTLGPLHTHTVISAIALADARLVAGDAVAAEAGFREALDAFERIGDGRRIYAEAARLGLGKALSAQGRCGEAEPALAEAHSRLRDEFGADDRRSIESAAELVHCLLVLQKRDAARVLLEASERALRDSARNIDRQRLRLDRARAEFDLPVAP